MRRLPESDVTVWETLSLFVHVTFVPTLIVKDDGLKEKLFISTEALETAVVLGVLETETVGVGVTDD